MTVRLCPICRDVLRAPTGECPRHGIVKRAEQTRGDLQPCPPDCFDQWWPPTLPNDPLVNMVVLGVAHHHATGHLCGGGGDVFDCEDCDFVIEDGRVLAGGWVRFLKPDVSDTALSDDQRASATSTLGPETTLPCAHGR